MSTGTMGQRIKQLRKGKKLTQQRLSEQIGISEKYLSNIETGRDICSTTVLLDIANALDASMDYLLGDQLAYNLTHPSSESDAHIQLIHKINCLPEKDCEHLFKYLDLLGEYGNP